MPIPDLFCVVYNAVPSDYDSVSNELLTFSPDVTRLPVIITIVDDDIVESVENFFADLNLTTTGADVELRPEQTEIRIRDNDGKYLGKTFHHYRKITVIFNNLFSP